MQNFAHIFGTFAKKAKSWTFPNGKRNCHLDVEQTGHIILADFSQKRSFCENMFRTFYFRKYFSENDIFRRFPRNFLEN
jgi:hypothetical protein